MEDEVDRFYDYFDENLNQWDRAHLESVLGELIDFLDVNFENFDRRSWIDLNDTKGALIDYLFDKDEEF